MTDHPFTLRAAVTESRHDGRVPITGWTLIAERDGVPVASLELASGSVVADPSRTTADAVRLLRRFRYQLLRQGGDVRPAWRLA